MATYKKVVCTSQCQIVEYFGKSMKYPDKYNRLYYFKINCGWRYE